MRERWDERERKWETRGGERKREERKEREERDKVQDYQI